MRHRRLSILDKEGIRKKLEENKIIKDGHWIWTGAKSHNYGSITIEKKIYGVHRIALYVYTDFDITNTSLHALHNLECNYTTCFNPEHLHSGTNKQNHEERSKSVQLLPTFPCGHPRVPENTQYCIRKEDLKHCAGIERRCRTCNTSYVYQVDKSK